MTDSPRSYLPTQPIWKDGQVYSDPCDVSHSVRNYTRIHHRFLRILE